MALLEDFARDLRFALRQLAKNPLFAIVIILSLGVAIGANTAIFTLLNAITLRQLSVPHASRLVEINETTSQNSPRAVTYAQLNELRARQSAFSSISGWLLPMENIEVNGNPSLRTVQRRRHQFRVLAGTLRRRRANSRPGDSRRRPAILDRRRHARELLQPASRRFGRRHHPRRVRSVPLVRVRSQIHAASGHGSPSRRSLAATSRRAIAGPVALDSARHGTAGTLAERRCR